MSDRDTITLPREVVFRAVKALTPMAYDTWPRERQEIVTALRTHLAAEQPKPEPVAYFDLQKQVFYWARPTMIDVPMTIALEPLPLYAAPPAAHPGYVIGSHWLETAYSRICAGEAEADVLRDCGWERVDDALRRDAERFRWLREKDGIAVDVTVFGSMEANLDAAIDAAMGDKT